MASIPPSLSSRGSRISSIVTNKLFGVTDPMAVSDEGDRVGLVEFELLHVFGEGEKNLVLGW
jgi:hypothetical protein